MFRYQTAAGGVSGHRNGLSRNIPGPLSPDVRLSSAPSLHGLCTSDMTDLNEFLIAPVPPKNVALTCTIFVESSKVRAAGNLQKTAMARLLQAKPPKNACGLCLCSCLVSALELGLREHSEDTTQ